MIVATLVKAFGYGYFENGLTLERSPIFLDCVVDYVAVCNENILKEEKEIALVEYQMSVQTKIKNISPRPKMKFNWNRFWKSLKDRGLKEIYEKKIFYGYRSNSPN